MSGCPWLDLDSLPCLPPYPQDGGVNHMLTPVCQDAQKLLPFFPVGLFEHATRPPSLSLSFIVVCIYRYSLDRL